MARTDSWIGSVRRKMNEFGWMKRRGGAAVAATAVAVMLAAALISMSFEAGAYRPDVPLDEPDEPEIPDDIIPWEKPEREAPAQASHGATPNRLPC